MREEIVKQAFERLYPKAEFNWDVFLDHSNRFSDYNANVKVCRNKMSFCLSRKWEGVNDEILIGLIQALLLKLFGKKKHAIFGNAMRNADAMQKYPSVKSTFNIDLYNEFLKSLHLSVPKDKNDPILESSFNRVNEKYFNGMIERPNLVWGKMAKRQLGSYDFHTDTIKITALLCNKSGEANIDNLMLDYVMYHEMLHKKLKFKANAQRNLFHSRAFRDAEKRFEGYAEAERRLKALRWNKAKKGFFQSLFGENFI